MVLRTVYSLVVGILGAAPTNGATGFEFLEVGFGVQKGGGVEYFFARGVCAFLLGVLRKTGVLTWCFGGEVVVFCVVDMVF